jgi:hypothetical protein
LKCFPQLTGVIGDDNRVYWNKDKEITPDDNSYEFKVQKLVRNYNDFIDLLCKEEMTQEERDNASLLNLNSTFMKNYVSVLHLF